MRPNWNFGVEGKSANVCLAALAAVFLSVGATSAHAAHGRPLTADEMYFTVGEPKIEIRDEGALSPSWNGLRPDTGVSDIVGGLNEANVVIDQIINLGKKIWPIIEANQPVVNIHTDTANALPEGVRGWQSLQGWKAPESRLFHVTYENLFGVTVVDFTARMIYTYGGSYNGKGKYLTQVTVMPATVDVVWGYTFDMTAAVPSVTNAGNSTDPVAAAQIELAWTVKTVLKRSQNTQSYYVTGAGQFKDLSGGTL